MKRILTTMRHDRRRGARAKVAALTLSLLAAALLSPRVTDVKAQEMREDEKHARVSDSVLGVRVGAGLKEVHDKLKSLGTVAGRDTEEGGRKEVWTFKKTDFTSLAYETNEEGRVEWVTAFVRAGHEIPFSKLGDLARAQSKSDRHARWRVEGPDEEGYVLMAKGGGGKAGVVQFFALDFEER